MIRPRDILAGTGVLAASEPPRSADADIHGVLVDNDFVARNKQRTVFDDTFPDIMLLVSVNLKARTLSINNDGMHGGRPVVVYKLRGERRDAAVLNALLADLHRIENAVVDYITGPTDAGPALITKLTAAVSSKYKVRLRPDFAVENGDHFVTIKVLR